VRVGSWPLLVIGTLALAWAGTAAADPCKAIPDKGRAPSWVKPGAVFSGTVRYIIDGDGFCVGGSDDHSTWVEVRLVDFDAPELRDPGGASAKAALKSAIFGRRVSCSVQSGRSCKPLSIDRVIARCTLEERSIASVLKTLGVVEGGN
jgi:micrococcal nuclease